MKILTLLILISSIIFAPYHGSAADAVEADPLSDIELLNEYVEFTNESIHGLLIIHRLLENFNQDINKYVDLEGYQLNDFSNADLPKDIFEDSEHWFYKRTPYEIYSVLQEDGRHSSDPDYEVLFSTATQMKNICRALNQLRFDIESYIAGHDLTDEEELKGIYELLEKGVTMYDDFYLRSVVMEEKIELLHPDHEHSKVKYLNHIRESHAAIKKILRALRQKSDIDYDSLMSQIKSTVPKIESANDPNPFSGRLSQRHTSAVIKIIEAHDNTFLFVKTAQVPKEYKLYGKFYYYHNSEVINKMNRYGNGYVKEVNEIIKDLSIPALMLVEEPHFYQVIYPKKLDDDETIVSTDDNIENLPKELLDREIITNTQTMLVDSMSFHLNLYDYKIKDGDIVSVNYNGDWVLENYSLEGKPIKLKIKLNPEGKNYLLIHAESIGRRPPNTSAVSYYFRGERQEIVMKSDLNASEMIEIKYVDPTKK